MSDASLWLPLGTAAIGAGAALAGNALGPLFGARGEHRQWLRNKRAVLLEDFHTVLDEALHASQAASPWLLTPPTAAEFMARAERSRAIFERLKSASARAELYVSPELANLMSLVTYDFHVVYASEGDYEPAEWGNVRDSWETDVRRCTALIRNELGVD